MALIHNDGDYSVPNPTTFIDHVINHIVQTLYQHHSPYPADRPKRDAGLDDYGASVIAGTKIIAGSGPQSPEWVSKYFKGVLCNEAVPIHKVFAIGASEGNYDDYWGERQDKAIFGKYQTESKKTCHYGICESELSICDTTTNKVKCVHVTMFPLTDRAGLLNLYQEGTVTDKDDCLVIPLNERLETFWKLFQNVKNENVFIHCSSGIRRTGEVVFALVLMLEYDKIFASDDPKIVAQEILNVFDRIKMSRSCMQCHEYDFDAVIRSVESLHRYGLQKVSELQVEAPRMRR